MKIQAIINEAGRKVINTGKRRKKHLVSFHSLERPTDLVRLYLRDTWNISLLTREEEIAIAREIERGEKTIVKALAKTRLVQNEILSLEDKIKEDPAIIQEMFDFSRDDIAEGKLEEKKMKIMDKIEEIRGLSSQLETNP